MMSGWLYKCRTAVCNLLTLAFQHGERGAFQPSAECTSAFALLDAAVLAPPAVSYTSFRELQQLLKNVSASCMQSVLFRVMSPLLVFDLLSPASLNEFTLHLCCYTLS